MLLVVKIAEKKRYMVANKWHAEIIYTNIHKTMHTILKHYILE